MADIFREVILYCLSCKKFVEMQRFFIYVKLHYQCRITTWKVGGKEGVFLKENIIYHFFENCHFGTPTDFEKFGTDGIRARFLFVIN